MKKQLKKYALAKDNSNFLIFEQFMAVWEPSEGVTNGEVLKYRITGKINGEEVFKVKTQQMAEADYHRALGKGWDKKVSVEF